MIRLSIPVRQALSRLTLPVMLMFSLCVVLVGRADQRLAEQVRTGLDDLLAPAYAVIAAPIQALETGSGQIADFFRLAQDNAALRAQNARLLQWQEVAMALASQNAALEAQLHYVPSPAPRFFTSRVVADLGGVYARSVLVTTPTGLGDVVGAIALDDRGLAGRVVEAGGRSARVLLITDVNSRIPVALGRNGARALMVGTNGPTPSLVFWSPDHPPQEGEIVLTSAEGGIFPPGLPVGVVHYDAKNDPVVLPLADLDSLRVLRMFLYPNALAALSASPAAPSAKATVVPSVLALHHPVVPASPKRGN